MKPVCKRVDCSNNVARNEALFCSRACRGAYRRGSGEINIYPQIRTCPECSENFSVTSKDKSKKFCSHSCSATYNNRGTIKSARKPCPVCGKQIKETRETCSSECRKTFKIDSWLSGEWDAITGGGLSRMVRNYLLSQADYKCTECGWSRKNPSTGKVPLQIDHIDGRWDNNRPENLRVLCPNCHSLTPTFGALNKGNGREYRYRVSSSVG